VIVAIVISAVTGLIFGLGLIISGMSDPAKVQNFLDLFGAWDPSLAFVMAGAIAVTFVGYRVAFGRGRPLLTDSFSLPTKTTIDPSLVGGAALFGVGWGLSGFCPGPAIVSLPLLATGTLVFVPAMLVGMVLARALQQKKVALAPSEATNG
jgi:uncharacterized protein